MSDATSPMRSLFMYPGYLRVVVDAAMTVLTIEFSWPTVGLGIRSRSTYRGGGKKGRGSCIEEGRLRRKQYGVCVNIEQDCFSVQLR